DRDAGPNTGGMGAYSPLPDLPDDLAEDLLDHFHRPVLAELARRGIPFRGALYAGLILTDEGPRLLEFNARFGDPETQVIVPRIESPGRDTSVATTSGSTPLRSRSERLDDPSLHPSRDGRALDGEVALRADAPGRAGRDPRAGRPGRGARRGPRHDRGAGHGR